MEFKGKTVEEATETGLKELNLTEDKAIITVLEEPTKGLFGKLKGQARIDIQLKEEPEIEKPVKKESKKTKKAEGKKETASGSEKEKEFLTELLKLLEINASIEESEQNGNRVFTLVSEDSSSVIGYRGEVLDAMQTLVGAVANIGKKDYEKIVVDCENYRDRREETLIKLAHKLEEKATEMRREVHLEPMSPFERRIIHTALAESSTVTTKSDGKEPNRFVIIVPNDLDEYSRPYNAGMNRERHGNDRHGKRSFGGKGFKGDRRGGERRSSGFSEQKRKPSTGFGTYLGNSLKDN